MKETEAWIKRQLRSMGSDHIVTKYKGTTWGDKYEIDSAILSECVLTIRQVSQHESHLGDGTVSAARNRQININRITMKDVDVGKGLRATEDPVSPDSTKSKPGYGISVVALSDRGDPFFSETDGYAGGKTQKSVRGVRIRVRDQNLGNQAGEVFRRAAVLCGAPNQPIETALAKTTPETQSPAASVTNPPPQGPSKMTNDEVIQLVTAGLSEQVVTTSIRQASTKNFDLTPTGLLALKKAGVSDALILVILGSGAPANPASPPEHTASALAGRYVTVRKKGSDYLDLTPHGTFHLIQGGKPYDGMYMVRGDTITVQGKSIRQYSMRVVANRIVEPDGSVWVKENARSETQSQITNPPPQGPSKMTNDEVIQLVTGGLSEQVVAASIRQAPTKSFDLTPIGLIALKKAGVPDAVIVAMQERGTQVQAAAASEAKTPPKYDATLAAPPKPEAAPVAQDGCAGVELMGLFTTDMRPMSPLIIYLAKIRNGTNLTRIVTIEWLDMYGQAMESTNQVGAGQIVTTQLGANSPSDRKPINLRLTSCR
jgi:hypothetical protein